MNSPRIIPAIVRGFFSSFVEGIVEGSLPEANGPQSVEPKQMKQLLLDHYEEIAECSFRNGCQAIVLDRHLFNKNGVEIPESLANRYYLSFENDDYLLYLRSSAKNEDS